jgi:homoserine acetyltransferase
MNSPGRPSFGQTPKPPPAHEPFNLEGGKNLQGVNIRYESYGQLNSQRGVTRSSSTTPSRETLTLRASTKPRTSIPVGGTAMIGPGKALDTDTATTSSATNVLVGLRGHHRSRQLQSCYRSGLRPRFSFGESILDMVHLQKVLVEHLRDHLSSWP